MLRSGWTNRRLALCIAPWITLAACGSEEAGPGDEPTEVEVRAVTATDPTRIWHRVTGFLMDIAVANGPPSRWGIDTNAGPGGFRVVKWSGSQWAATNGRGIRIALKGTGDANGDASSDVFVPWIINSDGHIFRATSSSGAAWEGVPDPAPGVTAVDIGSGPPAPNMQMWAAGSDGRVYEFDDVFQRWFRWADASDVPRNVIRVSGPSVGVGFDTVFALTSLGEVWAFTRDATWKRVGTDTDNLRTDVAARIMALEPGNGFMHSIMVTSSKANNQVRTYQGDGGAGVFVGTGPYVVLDFPPGAIPTHPIAVSAERERNRVWIVTADHRVYYGE